ncbi:MAG: Signal recognition particle receptor protein FtsY [Polyangiaceae bacterium]|jgi:fused signal recognition particle receptor|nr:Signal recognition particle receptor protein FtsY [Polyangiaceae bacterium]
MEFIYVLLALALAVGAYFLFLRKKEEPALPPREAPAPTSGRAKAAPEPTATKPESLKAKGPESAAASAHLEPSAEPQPEARPSRPAPPSRREAAAARAPEAAPVAPKPRDVSGLRRGLAKSREAEGFFGRLRALFVGKKELSADLVAQIEEVLLTSDVGVDTTAVLLEHVKATLAKNELSDAEAVWAELRAQCLKILEGSSGALELGAKPTVVLMVGVNGAGKTTTIGKLATKLNASGKKCVLAAGDTFRAAAVQQLVVWGERVGCEVVRGKDGGDPGSVVFDAIKRAQEVGADVVLADTAGRLHTKSNLMSEMKKIAKTAEKALPGAPHEILLVVDSTNGQNAFAQAKEFKEALPLTGIVLTKLDGTAKGGVVLGVANGLRVPVRYVGLGERPDDLHEFSAEDFVEALLGRESSEAH